MAQHGEKPMHGHIEKIENENDSTRDVITNETLSSEHNDNISAEKNDIAIINISEKEKNKILRKVYWRLVPLLTFLYLVAFVDRSNIGNAKIAGMTKDLKMVGLQYNITVTLFYIPYCLLEVPSNIILKMMRPSRWISILLFAWGLTMTLMGLVSSYKGLLAARWFLGVAEAGFFPAATFILTLWYKRYEYQRRLAIFYSMASMAGAFSGLLAFAIDKMDNIGGRSGWQWIFILEGLVPIICSLFMWKLLPDSPESARFLEQHEKEYIVNRIAEETGSGHGQVTNKDKIRPHHIWSAFKEWKIWALIIVYLGNSVGVYGFSATVPTVIKDLGYSAANAQLLTIPIYVFAVIMVLLFAWLSDRYQVRWIFIVVGYSIAGCGFIAQPVIPHPKYPGINYGFLFPIAGGMYSSFPPMISWAANNTSPSSKRAVAMALLISVGNMGAIAGSNVYLARESPKYHTGFGVSFAFLLGGIIMTCVLRFAYARENSKRDRTQEEMDGEEGMFERYFQTRTVGYG